MFTPSFRKFSIGRLQHVLVAIRMRLFDQRLIVKQMSILEIDVLLVLVADALSLPTLVVGHGVHGGPEPGGDARVMVDVVGSVLAVESLLPAGWQLVVRGRQRHWPHPGGRLRVMVNVINAVIIVKPRLPPLF